MNIKASQLFDRFHAQGILDTMTGPDVDITRIDPVEHSDSSSLIFVDNADFTDQALAAKPAAIVTDTKLAGAFRTLASSAILTCNNVRLAQALIRQACDDHDHHDTGWPAIHATATIHDTASLAEDVIIGPGVVIERNVTVGRGSVIKSNTVVERDVVVGEDCILHPNVVVAHGCQLGNRVILKSGCVIGMEGFGFAQDEHGRSHRIPQTGKVVIEDDVMVGTNCNIDRATYGETRIRSGCKFDALVHIAHNVDIGEDGLVLAHSTVAGSTTIGRSVIMSGQTGVLDHIKIADDTILVQRAGVINDIDTPGTYAGLPTQPAKDYFRNVAVAHKLVELRKQVRQLEKQITELKKNNTE